MKTLSEWLQKLENLHAKQIDLGLERVREVALNLQLLPWKIPTITVAGTNGKGSCTALTAMILHEAGYKTGGYFSPHLFRFNERIQINTVDVADDLICEAFAAIDIARGNISLTYFEFATLAALLIFKKAQVDFAILEVGLGGRLDAVNIIDADIAVISSIDLDHEEWLGNTREAIAIEKAGILRANQLAICGDVNPPETLIQYAKQLQTKLFLIHQDFSYKTEKNWHWFNSANQYLKDLPMSRLYLDNAATVLQAISLLKQQYTIEEKAIRKALENIQLPGRYEWIEMGKTHIFDVAHNPHATTLLAKRLAAENFLGKIYAVFSMLNDKNMVESIRPLKRLINHWYFAPLDNARAASLMALSSAFEAHAIKDKTECDSLSEAYQQAVLNCTSQDVIVIFGSFYTVALVKAMLAI